MDVQCNDITLKVKNNPYPDNVLTKLETLDTTKLATVSNILQLNGENYRVSTKQDIVINKDIFLLQKDKLEDIQTLVRKITFFLKVRNSQLLSRLSILLIRQIKISQFKDNKT